MRTKHLLSSKTEQTLFLLLFLFIAGTKSIAQNNPSDPIDFADATVKALCVANWDTNSDGELSYDEAAAVTELGSVFGNNSNITSFNELQYFTGLKSIGNYAFAACFYLTSVTLPNSITSLGFAAFASCRNLSALTLPNSLTIIGNRAFQFDSSLTSIIIPNSVTTIEEAAFDQCTGLTSLILGNNVTTVGESALWGCSGLASLIIPASVTDIGLKAFYNCSGLTSIKVEEGNTVYDSRSNCNAIIKTKENELIVGCINTVIPNTVTSIGDNAFYGCTGLVSITIPNSVKSIGDYAFQSCTGLTSFMIPKSVTNIGGGVFAGCNGLTSIEIEDGNTAYISVEGVIYNTNRTTLLWYPVSKTDVSYTIPSSVTTIKAHAFDGSKNLTSVTLPEGLVTIGESAFSNCIGLTSIHIPNSVTTIGSSAFLYCISMKTLIIGKSVREIGQLVFACCDNLAEVTSYIEKPFALEYGVFIKNDWKNYSSATLYVPAGTKSEYASTEGWKNFKNIVEMEDDNTSSDKVIEANCAEVIAGEDDKVYRVTGRVASIVNTNYGNWYLEDETGRIYIYGTYDKYGRFPKSSSWESFGINEGDVITVQGPKTTYNGTTELVNVRVLEPLTILSDMLIYLNYEAGDVAINLYCSGEPCEVTISDEATSWLTVKRITEGPDVVVTLHAEENKSITRYATVTFKKTVDGKEYTDQVNIYQNPYMFTAKTKEGVEMMFRVSYDGEKKSCAVAGIGEDPRGYYPAIDTQTAGHITIPGEANGYAVISIDFYAFKDCQELTGITIPEGLITINNYAFQGCTKLSEINFPSYLLDFGPNVFDDTPWFTNQPDGVIYIKNLLYTYKGEMPENTVIKVPDGCTSISYGAFLNRTNLASIELPAGLERIGAYAFSNSGIKKISVPANCTNIYTRGFKSCENLEEVTLLGKTNLGVATFTLCPNLKKISVYSPEPFNINSNAFYYRAEDKNDNSIYDRATLYVPVGSKALYEAAESWKEFTNIIEMEELQPVDEGENIDFGEGSEITKNTDLDGTVVNNMFYSIGTDAGGYNSEDGCIVITKDTSDEQMAALEGLDITSEELKQNFTGIIFKVPAGSGKVTVTAETTGNMTLKVKVGNSQPMEMELSGKLKMKVPYDVAEETMVYIFAGTTGQSSARGLRRMGDEPSVRIYGISVESGSETGVVDIKALSEPGDVYSVNGHLIRKSVTSLNGLPKGVYIINGHKVVK